MTLSSKSKGERDQSQPKNDDKTSPPPKKATSKLSTSTKAHQRVRTLPKPRKELNMNKIVASESRALFMDKTEADFHQRSTMQKLP